MQCYVSCSSCTNNAPLVSIPVSYPMACVIRPENTAHVQVAMDIPQFLGKIPFVVLPNLVYTAYQCAYKQ